MGGWVDEKMPELGQEQRVRQMPVSTMQAVDNQKTDFF